jgi:hypothetical protein
MKKVEDYCLPNNHTIEDSVDREGDESPVAEVR